LPEYRDGSRAGSSNLDHSNRGRLQFPAWQA